MKKILVINSNYYKEISNNLLLNVKKKLIRTKFQASVINVPGIYEIPSTIRMYINKFDGFIALGCVIKGQTPHFDFISSTITNALMDLSFKFNAPISNGVLTCLNQSQAKVRSSGKKNKGIEAANALLSILRSLK